MAPRQPPPRADLIPFTPASGLSATNLQDAVAELAAKATLSTGPVFASVLWTGDMEEANSGDEPSDWYHPSTQLDGDYGGWIEVESGATVVRSSTVAHAGTYSARKQIPGTTYSGAGLIRWRETSEHQRVLIESWNYLPAAYTIGGSGYGVLERFNSERSADDVWASSWVLGWTNPSAGVMRPEILWELPRTLTDGDLDKTPPDSLTVTDGTGALRSYDAHPSTSVTFSDFPIAQWYKSTWDIKQAPRSLTGHLRWYLNDVLQFELLNVRTALPNTATAWGAWNHYSNEMYGEDLGGTVTSYTDDARIGLPA